MRFRSLTLRASRTNDGVKIPPSWAGICAAFLLLLAAPVCRATAAPNSTKAELSVNTSGGYARFVFRFEDDVESDVRLANGILVISFKRPVDVSVNRVDTNAPAYVSAARRDPDGMAIRIALKRKVTVNSMAAGERLFVDLLPDTWTGMPPGLPQEVVEELARRAREAERKVREQRQLAQQRQLPPIRVRIAKQPTFSRYVFELPELMSVSSDRNKDKFTLAFDAPLKFDLADAIAAQPPTVQSLETAIKDQTTKVTFTFSDKVDVRTFREDYNYVVDVGALDAMDKRVDALLAGRPVTPNAGNPAAAAPAAPSTEEPAARPVPAAPTTEPARSDSANAPVPPATPANSVGAAPVPEAPQHNEPPPAASVAERKATPASSLTDEKFGGSAAVPERDASGPVVVEMRRQSDSLKLTFPFASPTPAAVFRRADTLWLVFDTDAKIDAATLDSDPTRTIRDASVSRSREGQVVRIRLERPRLTSLSAEGLSWTVTVGDVVLEPTAPLAIARNAAGSPRASALIPFDTPHVLHRLSDPEVGDTLLVVTALGPARGFVKTQDFVEFRALASTHGVVIQPLADDLNVELQADRIVLGRPSGLTLSSAAQSPGRGSSNLRPVVFDTQLWGFNRETAFAERQKKLLDAAADAPETKRTAPRLELARFYLAHDMYAEAKGVLDVTLSDERPTTEDTTGVVMRAVADIMLGRPEDGLKDLANPLVGNQNDAPVWRAVAQAKAGKWAAAREGFRNVNAAIATLPLELQRIALREAVRASIEARDFAGAANHLNEFETIGVSPDLQPEISVLTGRLAEGLGRTEEALSAYRLATVSQDRSAAAQAKLREVVLRYQQGDLKPTDVISELETLTTIWRGDETEIEALQLLGRLYTEEARYRDAFYVMRTAMQAHPNSEMTRQIQDEAAATFDQLFLAGKSDAMPTIDALSLFYDFRELTPIGRRGDEMIRRLADRLVSVDLLDQAAELLQHQVDHRLQGAARAQVATRLAVIYLMNRKPDRTLATLRATRSADLSNELRNERLLLEARALSDMGRHDVALEIIANIDSKESTRLRSDVLWAAKRWRESAEQIELLYGDRWRDWQPLNDAERADIMRAAIGYALAEDRLGAQRFREKYAAKMAESADRRTFDVVTSRLGSSAAEFQQIAKTIAATDTLEAFLRDMRARYPETGTLTPSTAPAAGATPPKSAPPPAAQSRAPRPGDASAASNGRVATR
jgi:tetratricopeptide (TPR) repeat protein